MLFFAMDAHAGIIIKPVHNFGLVGYWDFQEGAGNTVSDRSGQGNTGTWNGTGSHWTTGKIGAGGNFNGSDDYVNVGNPAELQLGNTGTIAAWILEKDDGRNHIVGKNDWPGDRNGYTFEAAQGGDGKVLIGEITDGSGMNQLWSNTPLQNDRWYHVVFIWDGSYLRIYLDGVSDATPIQQTLTPVSNVWDFYIGNCPSYSDCKLNGKMDEVRIYNRALSASEVERLYKLSQPKVGINRLGPVSDDLPANAAIAYVREDCAGYSPCYHSLYDWEAAYGGIDFSGCTPGDLTCANVNKTAVAKIDGPWAAADPDGAVTISGWTTDATRYIKIYTTAAARHPGKWDETKYRMEVTVESSGVGAINIYENYVTIDGLQFKVSNSSTISTYAITIAGTSVDSAVRISNNIFRTGSTLAGTYSLHAIHVSIGAASCNAYIWNNIIYDFNSSTGGAGVVSYADSGQTLNTYVYNNTFVNNTNGLVSTNASVMRAKNNIVKGSGNSNAYVYQDVGNFSDTDYNATDGTDTTGQGAHSRTSQTFNFYYEANNDFHLAVSDTGARDYGTNLSADAILPFSNDIDRQNRSVPWDIGADEALFAKINTSQNNQITNGLVGLWSFNGPDIDGNEAIDRSGQGNTGTIIGATVINGKVGQALSFNGVDDVVSVPDNPSLDENMNGVTMSAWIKWKGTGDSYQRIIAKNDYVDYAMFVHPPDKNFGASIETELGLTDFYATGVITPTNEWVHLVATWDNQSQYIKLYVNGVYQNGAERTGNSINGSANSLCIGAWPGRERTVNGLIDEVRVYNRALSVQEIQRLYNLGR